MFTFVSFVGFTLLVAGISYFKTRNDKMDSSDAYFLGGRSLTAWTIAGSLILTNLSTEHLIGLNADVYNHTIAIAAWEITAALAMVLLAIYFLPKYLNAGLTTIPQFFNDRYDEHTRVIATVLFLLSYSAAILPIILLFGATGLESLFNVSDVFGLSRTEALWFTVWSVGCLGSLYAIFGGLKAVAISDTINGIGFLIAGLMIPILGLFMIGDGNFFAGLSELYTEEHEKFDITGDEPGSFLPVGVLFTGLIVNQIFFWCTNQSIIQRVLAAKNLKEGQKGVLVAAFFKLLGPFIIILPGVIAFHMFKDELPAEDYLLAYPMLVKAVLPTVLTGFFAAVMIGAVLSTFNSVLNSSATLFCEGIYKVFVKRQVSGRELVKAGRITSIVLAISAMTAAPLIDSSGSLFNVLQKINATFFGPMLAVILLGILTPHVSAFAAKMALIVGPVIFYLLVFGFGDYVQIFLKNVFGTTDDIHFLHLLAFVFVITVLGMLIISYFKPAEKAYHVKPTDVVDMTPWRHVKPVSIGISLLTLLYFIFLHR